MPGFCLCLSFPCPGTIKGAGPPFASCVGPSWEQGSSWGVAGGGAMCLHGNTALGTLLMSQLSAMAARLASQQACRRVHAMRVLGSE